jgi:hypothetical protein
MWELLAILETLLLSVFLEYIAVILALRTPVADDWPSNLNRLIPLDTKNQRLYNDALMKMQLRPLFIGPHYGVLRRGSFIFHACSF